MPAAAMRLGWPRAPQLRGDGSAIPGVGHPFALKRTPKPAREAVLLRGVPHVGGVIAEEQVIWSDAAWCVAVMANAGSGGDWPMCQAPCEAVGFLNAVLGPRNVKDTVVAAIRGPVPKPAACRPRDLGPEGPDAWRRRDRLGDGDRTPSGESGRHGLLVDRGLEGELLAPRLLGGLQLGEPLADTGHPQVPQERRFVDDLVARHALKRGAFREIGHLLLIQAHADRGPLGQRMPFV